MYIAGCNIHDKLVVRMQPKDKEHLAWPPENVRSLSVVFQLKKKKTAVFVVCCFFLTGS